MEISSRVNERMHCSSQSIGHVKSFGSSGVPRYTILPRPSSHDELESSMQSLIIQSASLTPTYIAKQGETAQTSALSSSSESIGGESGLDCQTASLLQSQTQVPSQEKSSAALPGTSTGDHSTALDDSEVSPNIPNNQTVRWTPEKTPICRVNEVARFNKVPLQFALVAEEGPPHQKTFYVQLTLGDEVYHGSASNMKRAQHNVANMALERTRYQRPPVKINKTPVYGTVEAIKGVETVLQVGDITAQNTEMATDMLDCDSPDKHEIPNDDKTDALAKSVINEVQELAVKIGLLVTYEVLDESPAPNISYTMSCTCGALVTLGNGSSKKAAKKDAAGHMLEALRAMTKTIISESAESRSAKKVYAKRKKMKSLVKMLPVDAPFVDASELSYAVRLHQIQMAKKGNLPIYSDAGVRGAEFLTEVSVEGINCTGTGRTKKQSKQDAAYKMLQALGFPVHVSESCGDVVSKAVPAKSALKKRSSGASGEKKVTFIEPDEAVDSGETRALSPHVGLSLTSTAEENTNKTDRVSCVFPGPSFNGQPRKVQILKRPSREGQNRASQPVAGIAESASQSGATLSSEEDFNDLLKKIDAEDLSPSQRLQKVADLRHTTVQFADLPKSTNGTECVAIVSVSTNPPLVIHGTGKTLELARDAASQEALSMLKEFASVKNSSAAPPEDDVRTPES